MGGSFNSIGKVCIYDFVTTVREREKERERERGRERGEREREIQREIG